MFKLSLLRATCRSAAIHKFIDCFLVLLLTMTFVGFASAQAEETPDPVCQILERHTPTNDVAYQAGIDVYGNAVVPADLNAQIIAVPEVIKVPLNIDLAERIGSMVEGLDLEAPLGMLEISQNGHVRYNDQDWSAPVATLCGQSHKVIVEEKTMINAGIKEPVEDRLETQDAIKSVEVKNDIVQEVAPVVAIPPLDVVIEQLEVNPPIDAAPESDVIEGGEYREIFYNE